MRSIFKRPSDFSTSLKIWSRERLESFGPSPTDCLTFVAITISSLWFFRNSPTISSDLPSEYTLAVSKEIDSEVESAFHYGHCLVAFNQPFRTCSKGHCSKTDSRNFSSCCAEASVLHFHVCLKNSYSLEFRARFDPLPDGDFRGIRLLARRTVRLLKYMISSLRDCDYLEHNRSRH